MLDNRTETVKKISEINFESFRIIPNSWYKHIKYSNGKPNINAIIILAEIISYYKHTINRNEITGEIIGYSKKFQSDKLQKNYEALGNQFGLSKNQVKGAIYYLKEKQLINIEFRNIKIQNNNGVILNRLFIEPIPENIIKINSFNDEISCNQVKSNVNLEVYTPIHENIDTHTLKDTYPNTEVEYTSNIDTSNKTTKNINTNIGIKNIVTFEKSKDDYVQNIFDNLQEIEKPPIEIIKELETIEPEILEPNSKSDNNSFITNNLPAIAGQINIIPPISAGVVKLDKQQTKIEISQIIEYLNLKTNKNYRSNIPKTIVLIEARMKEGFVLNDFKTVIDKKVNEWLGTEMEKYLRPETLFGNKFEGYLNQEWHLNLLIGNKTAEHNMKLIEMINAKGGF